MNIRMEIAMAGEKYCLTDCICRTNEAGQITPADCSVDPMGSAGGEASCISPCGTI